MIHAHDVEGVCLYEDMEDGAALETADERPPDFTAHLFRSNDYNLSSLVSAPGSGPDWHTPTPHI